MATTNLAPASGQHNNKPQPESQELTLVNEGYSSQATPATGRLLVRPIATPADVKANFEEFQKLKISLLDQKTDIQVYKDQKGNITRRIKKSGCKKIATAFGLDVKAVSREVTETQSGNLVVEYTVRATAPNGRATEAIGMCDTTEPLYANRKNHKLHDVYATAFTRAANRAVLDLVGGGEVSAEEVTGEEPVSGRQPIPQAWLDKLDTLVKDLPDGKKKLAEFVFEEIGARYLSKEEIVRVAEKLQKEKARVVTPAAIPAPAQTPAPAKAQDKEPQIITVANTQTDIANLTPELQERIHRAAWIEEAAHVQTCTPAGKWMSVTGDQFDKAAQLITGGRDLLDILDAMGIEKFSTEAKRRYPTQVKTYDQQLAAGLHILAEWCESHPAETIFPDVEGDSAAGDDFFADDEEFDDDQEEYIK